MKHLIPMGLLTLGAAVQLLAVDVPTPSPFLTNYGAFRYTNGNRTITLTMASNDLQLAIHTGTASNQSGPGAGWRPQPGWFVHVTPGWHAWAFDGRERLWYLEVSRFGSLATTWGGASKRPPSDVLQRLPAAMRKEISSAPRKR